MFKIIKYSRTYLIECVSDIIDYWKKYRVKLSKKEAERILMEDMRDRGRGDFGHAAPPPPRDKKPGPPHGPQRPPRK
jgi:hypothetical protein